jgi:TonB family protein
MEATNYTLPVLDGPHRLKAAYQRNMLWAMGATTGFVTLAVALGAVLLGSSTVPAVPPIAPNDFHSDTVVIRISQPPTVKFDGPKVKPSRQNPHPNSGGNLTPVADGVLNTNEVVIPYTPGGTGTGDTVSGGGFGEDVIFDTGDALPPIDSFMIVERQPELVFSVEPEYPRWVRDLGIEGEVVIKALVGRKGDVLDAVVYVSSGNKLLDEAALAVAGKYKYQPAVQNGRPVAIWVTYKVAFKLSK